MKKFLEICFIALTVLCLFGCAGRVPKDPTTTSLVFGYVDMSEAPKRSDMDTIKLMRAVPQKKPTLVKGRVDYPDGVSMSLRPGNFWVYNLVPGTYQVAEITGMSPGFSTGPPTIYHFHFPQNLKNASTISIEKPDLYFMGSFKVIGSKNGGFEMVRVNKPAEKEVLERVLYRNRMPYWEPIIKKRLAELSR